MIWGVNMLPDTYVPNTDPRVAGGSCDGLTQGAHGRFDHYFRSVAANIVRAGFPISVIRFGWEFNGNWSPWAAQGCAAASSGTSMRSSRPCARFRGRTSRSNGTRPGGISGSAPSPVLPGEQIRRRRRPRRLRPRAEPVSRSQGRVPPHADPPDGLRWLTGFAAVHHKAIVLPEWGLGWGTCSKSGQPISASGQVCGGDNATWVKLMAKWAAATTCSKRPTGTSAPPPFGGAATRTPPRRWPGTTTRRSRPLRPEPRRWCGSLSSQVWPSRRRSARSFMAAARAATRGCRDGKGLSCAATRARRTSCPNFPA